MSASPRLWLIGCGNMAGAMLRRWIESGMVAADAVDVVNRHDRDLPAGVRQGRDLPAGPLPDLVMLGMKPQQLDEVAGRFSAGLSDVPLLVSILAGIEEGALAERFPGPNIVRAMPNLPVAFGKGVVALYARDRDRDRDADADAAARAETLMCPLGLVEWVDDEALFNAVTALSGSGPGFVFRFIDALAHAGAALGLPADQAARFATATMEGAAVMASSLQESAAALADRVASPGGSTREGLNVLDRDGALVKLMDETLAAACRRNAEMAAAAR